MIITAHQPPYLPWLGFFHKVALADRYVYLDTVQFEKNSFINRNKIKTSNGVIWLTVPVFIKGHMKTKIKDIKINNVINWRKNHWLSIYYTYKKAPYFSRYSDFFECVYRQDWTYLCDINEYTLKFFLKELNIKTQFIKASECDFEGVKSNLVLDISKKLRAESYISGKLGRDYVDKEEFDKENLKIVYQEYNHPAYPQGHGSFEPYMSIVDLLMNCGNDSLEIIMKNNSRKH